MKKNTPAWFYYQTNGKSAEENLSEQKKKFHKEINQRKQIQELEESIYVAVMSALSSEIAPLTEAAGDEVVTIISNALGLGYTASGGLHGKSFSAQLGAALGMALGQAPFKLLEEMLRDDDE